VGLARLPPAGVKGLELVSNLQFGFLRKKEELTTVDLRHRCGCDVVVES
jgi:hypothetical protein